jgi:hypothetical protein
MTGNSVPIRDISNAVGHKSTHVTDTVYGHVIRPTIWGGATIMDDVFGDDEAENHKTRLQFSKNLVELRVPGFTT